MRSKSRFLAARLAQIAATLLAIAVLGFFLLHLAPGDVADVLAGEAGAASPEYLALLRQQFGLDQPLSVRFAHFMLRLLTFDLGVSHRHGLPVGTLIAQRLPATLLLVGTSMLIAVLLGVALGGWAGWRAGRLADHVISTLSLLAYATPMFWIGLMLIVVFASWLDWFPVAGMASVEKGYGGLRRLADVAWHMVLPVTTLTVFYMATYIRLMRASVIDTLRLDFVRTAHAKGMTPMRVGIRHVMRNALLPLVTVVGAQAGAVLGGSVLVEAVFAWPGLGWLAFESLFKRDLNLLLGILMCSSVVVMAFNLLIDLLYAVLDPRIEAGLP